MEGEIILPQKTNNLKEKINYFTMVATIVATIVEILLPQ